jgi:hypothetical protein
VNANAVQIAVFTLVAGSEKGQIQRFRAGKVEATAGFEPANGDFAARRANRFRSFETFAVVGGGNPL